MSLRMCLVEWILERMEKKGEKIRREMFLEDVWLWGREGKETVGPGCFLPWPTKKFSPKWGENWVGGCLIGKRRDCPCAVHLGFVELPCFPEMLPWFFFFFFGFLFWFVGALGVVLCFVFIFLFFCFFLV